MGIEPTGELLCRQPPYRLAPASSVLARNQTWTSTFAGLHANPAHPEDVNFLAARRGVEPRLAVSRTAVQSGTLAGCVNQYPDLDLNQDLDLRRVQCNPLHHRDKQSRRLDLHQHLPVYKTGAFCGRATSATCTSARSRTPWSSFGGCRLSQEHTRVCCPSHNGQPGYPKGVEPLPPGSQPGMQRPLHHRHHVNQQLDQDLNPELCVRTAA